MLIIDYRIIPLSPTQERSWLIFLLHKISCGLMYLSEVCTFIIVRRRSRRTKDVGSSEQDETPPYAMPPIPRRPKTKKQEHDNSPAYFA